jgi:two-component system response regulator NreC
MERVIGNAAGKRLIRDVPGVKNLSHREEEILRLSAWGYLNKEIAARLHISIKTAEADKANAMAKIGMKSRIDIVRYALLNDWLEDADSQT